MKDDERVNGMPGLTGFEIAVVGMTGRFPAANGIEEFWENLAAGKESISYFPDEELKQSLMVEDFLKNPNYIKACGWMTGHDLFDASFFGYTPLEAEIMDPQIRIFHEIVLGGLENAGYDPYSYKKLIGLYAGASANFTWQAYMELSGKSEIFGRFAAKQLNDKDFLATRIAYRLNLKGPALTVDTACSTSLMAIHLASQGLLSGDCDMAVAGGVNISIIEKSGYIYVEGMINSSDGHCRAFDVKADGSNFGNAAAVVVLKRYEDALADGDTIHAVIKGSAINNDGGRKAAYTAPSIEGQSQVIRTAHKMAEVDPETITYIETHGTGTILGDPVEIEGLKAAFNTKKKHFCRIGSVKTNVGHLEIAAGVAGFIKTVLALKHKQIPPSLFFETPNPRINFENSPFIVNTALTPWRRQSPDCPLRAGVSSFGIGGTNVHVVLEEAPEELWEQSSGTTGQATRPYQLLLLSAKTESALERMTANLVQHLKDNLNIHPSDVAFTLQAGRRVYQHRRMLVYPSENMDRMITDLTSSENGRVKTYYSEEDNQPIVFMFPGIGSQYVNMGRELYESEPLFRDEMNRCFEILENMLGYNIKDIIYPRETLDKSYMSHTPASTSTRIDQPEISQLAVFIFEIALARLLMAWGIKPQAMIGYSFGEYVAACISGVFSLEDGLRLVVARGKIVQKMPEGAMLSVPLTREEITPLLKKHELEIGIDNGPSCIVAGTRSAIQEFEKEMKDKRLICMEVPVTRALHSSAAAPVFEDYRKILETVSWHKPQIRYISNVTGDWIEETEAMESSYWTWHLGRTVEFAGGMKKLLRESNSILLEVGPGRDLSTLTLRHLEDIGLAGGRHQVMNLVRHPHQQISDVYFLLERLGKLWLHGQSINWEAFQNRETRKPKRIPLPTYPFAGQRYWFDLDFLEAALQAPSALNQGNRGKELSKHPGEFADWFYIPTWIRSPLLAKKAASVRASQSETVPETCLVFVDKCGLGELLATHLEKADRKVIRVEAGDTFAQRNKTAFVINPLQSLDYERLIRTLGTVGKEETLLRIIHFWGVTGKTDKEDVIGAGKENNSFEQAQEVGFYSLLSLVKAMGNIKNKNVSRQVRIAVITDQMQEVTGDEVIQPEKATILGAVKVIPQELPCIRCSSIDILVPEPGSQHEQVLLRHLVNEVLNDTPEAVSAIRGDFRWVQTFTSLRLENEWKNHTLLKEKGIYLILGGTGNIGMNIAEYLAGKVKARLVLTGRTSLPPREEWENHPGHEKLQRIKKLEEMGAEVVVSSTDAADPEQMQSLINRVENQWGEINGVIHSAGILRGDTIRGVETMEKSHAHEQFQAKVQGLQNLEVLFSDKKLDFCWIVSSISTVLGGLGLSAYSAASCYMDAFVKRHNRSKSGSGNWFSLAWDGMDAEKTQAAFIRTLGLTQQGVYEVVASNGGNLNERLERWVNRENNQEEQKPAAASTARKPRPELMNPYEPPKNQVEQQLVQIWQKFFGFETLGVLDDFVELGGDSLKAINLITRIHKEMEVSIPLAEFFKAPTIQKLAEFISGAETDTYHSIPRVEEKEYYSLSAGQKRLYVLHQMDPDTVGYNLAATIILEGEVDCNRLEKSFRQLIRRHEILRTSFHMIDNVPVQQIHEDVEFRMQYYNSTIIGDTGNIRGIKSHDYLCGEPAIGDMQDAAALIKDFIRPFDLSQAPLLRVALIENPQIPVTLHEATALEEGTQKFILVVDMHHIAHDGISQTILLRELMSLYGGRNLDPLRIQYKDYSQWQQLSIAAGAMKMQQDYWLRIFQGEIPVLDLPYDNPRPVVLGFEGEVIRFEMGTPETQALKDLVRSEGATLFVLIQAIYNVLLAKLSDQEDIVVGTPIAGRSHPDLEPVIGFFLNTLALRNCPHGQLPFRTFLNQVKESTLKAFENQEYPFEDLVERLGVNRDLSRNPLFDVMLVLHNQWDLHPDEIREEAVNDFILRPYSYEKNTSEFDLTLIGYDGGDRLGIKMEYSTRLFNQETMHRCIGFFNTLVSGIIANPDKKIAEIEIISSLEKQRILMEFNDTSAVNLTPAYKTAAQLFLEQVEQSPDRVAVIGNLDLGDARTGGQVPQSVTYRELHNKVRHLADRLRENDIGPEKIVGIMMERSIEMVIGVLGVVTAGGAYLPVNPRDPEDRINYLLADSGVELILTDRKDVGTGNLHVLALDIRRTLHEETRNQQTDCQEKGYEISRAGQEKKRTGHCPVPTYSLAYILYTSGSTGKPKGVMVEHGSLINILSILSREYPCAGGDNYLLKTSFLFDVSVTELYGWYITGGRLTILAPGGERDPQIILDTIERYGVTHINFVPSMFNAFVQALTPKNLRKLSVLKYIFLAGEALWPELVTSILEQAPHIVLENLYGPTEATVYASRYSLRQWKTNGHVPIGKPLEKINLSILNRWGRMQPIGIPGELVISGAGIARGYLNNPELTNDKFISYIPDKSYMTNISIKLYYKTGDLARWQQDGNIEFLGRKDHQVKINGIRIELGEIEALILKQKGIREAVVIAGTHETGLNYLAAYVVVEPSLKESINEELRENLSRQLPVYMIPSYLIMMERIPLTSTGKIDRKALPQPDQSRPQLKQVYIEPVTSLEKRIAEVWKRVLKLEQIGIDDNFFELGGNSLGLVTITNILRNELDMEIPVVTMFKNRTIRTLALYVEADEKGEHEHEVEILKSERIQALSRGERRKKMKLEMRKRISL